MCKTSIIHISHLHYSNDRVLSIFEKKVLTVHLSWRNFKMRKCKFNIYGLNIFSEKKTHDKSTQDRWMLNVREIILNIIVTVPYFKWWKSKHYIVDLYNVESKFYSLRKSPPLSLVELFDIDFNKNNPSLYTSSWFLSSLQCTRQSLWYVCQAWLRYG